jgi:uncharacterized protein
MNLSIVVLPERYAVCRLRPEDSIPTDLFHGRLCSVTRTENELSIVLLEEDVQAGWQAERGWRCLKVLGPLDFSLTGILSGISGALAEECISIFALSTYDTDYILIPHSSLEKAVSVLSDRGYNIL